MKTAAVNANEPEIVTVQQHILAEQRKRSPTATGSFSWLLSGITLATKMTQAKVRRAGLLDVTGAAGGINVQGEVQQKLDVYADQALVHCLGVRENVAIIASEESDEAITFDGRSGSGKYVVVFDPLDGSSNIDVNVSIGTIFSIHRKISTGERGALEDCLQPGTRQVAAGYVLYGSSTMLVYTTGTGVHGFTLDPSIGEFILSHPRMKMPEPPKKVYSVNEAYYARWTRGQQLLVSHLKTEGGFGSRYIGSLVADIHRTLLQGGLFMYPTEADQPEGKLRLMYEAAPMAMIIEQAGGRASTGSMDIMDVEPDSLHQRVPLYMGSKDFVDLAERMLAEGE